MQGITGATGFVGLYHVVMALRAGEEVKVLVRDARVLAPLRSEKLHIIEGDLADTAALDAFCEGLDTCYHYAARANFKGDWKRFEEVNLKGTEALLRAAAKVDRFIFCSSYSSVLRDVHRHEADETLPYPRRFLDNYGKSKALAEQACLRLHPGATVMRPPWTWGAGDTNNLAALLRAHQNGQLRMAGDGLNLVETVHVQNVVNACILAARDDAARGQVYFVTDDEPLPYKHFCQQLLQSCALPPTIKTMPQSIARLLAKVDGLAGNPLGMTRSAISYMSRTKTFSDAKIRAHLGYAPETDRADGLADLRRWVDHVGGPAQIGVGRRRGANSDLMERTCDYLMQQTPLLKSRPLMRPVDDGRCTALRLSTPVAASSKSLNGRKTARRAA